MPRIYSTLLPAALLLLSCTTAHAELPDIVGIITDDINDKGELSLDMHANSTPLGASLEPAYQGEVLSNHGIRLTPSLTYGLKEGLELMVSLPIVQDGNTSPPSTSVAGTRARLTWISNNESDDSLQSGNKISGDEADNDEDENDQDSASEISPPNAVPSDTSHAYWGSTVSILATSEAFEFGQTVWDIGLVGGYRTNRLHFALNAFVSNGLANDLPSMPVDHSLNGKLVTRIAERIWGGIEMYSAHTKAMTIDGVVDWFSTKSVFGVIEIEGAKNSYAFGVGRGLNENTDPWTLKCLVSLPL